jgi:hypothetical protein
VKVIECQSKTKRGHSWRFSDKERGREKESNRLFKHRYLTLIRCSIGDHDYKCKTRTRKVNRNQKREIVLFLIGATNERRTALVEQKRN